MKTKFNGILTLFLALVVQISFAQEKTVSGTVTDDSGGLPGVSVLIKGTTKGTDTDFNGAYSIKANVGDVLVFSYLGYKTVERKVGSAGTINVKMEEGGEVLDEIVVTSYGRALNSPKSAASLARVDGKQIENIPINSVDQVLQGNAAGVNVNTGSGQPGQSATIIIRGISSLEGDIEPLFIVDGIPVDQDNFRSINQNDIADIQVLKDAAATSLYGNRGAGGVILITTKRGKLGQKLDIQVRTQYGVASKPKTRFDVMNAEQYLTWGNQYGIGRGASLNPQQIAQVAAQSNTNWEDIFFRLGNTSMHEISFSSGTENSTSYSSVNYFEQEGITLASKLTRFSFRTNNSGRSANKRFNYSTQVSLNYSVSNFVVDAARGANTGGQLDNPFIVPYIGLPWYSPFNPDGSLNIVGTQDSGALFANGEVNPNGATGFLNTPYLTLNSLNLQTDQESEIRAIIGLSADFKLTDDIKVGGSFGLDYFNIQSLFIQPPESLRGLNEPTVGAVQKGTQEESTFRDAQFTTNAFIRYDKQITEKIFLSAAVFGEYIYRNTQNEGFNAFGLNPALPTSGNGFTSGATEENDAFPYIPDDIFSTETESALGSVFATLDADYDGKYGLSASIRRDETSRFPNNPVGYFWSVAGRWNLDKEDFLSDSDVISTLKLRASYGTVGNQNVGNRYQGLQVVDATSVPVADAGAAGTTFAYQGLLSYFTPQISSQAIQWETKQSLNIGFSFGLWNDRLAGELDFYNEKTVDLFGSDNISVANNGFTTVITNVGSLRNRGIDLQLSYALLTKSATNPWSIKLNFNGNFNDNEVIDIGSGDFTTVGGSNLLRNPEGRPARSHFRVRWAGVDPSNGQPLYLDPDGNVTNVWNTNNRVYVDKSAIPTYTGGFGGDISYKNFNLNFQFSYVADVWRNNGSLGVIEDVSLAGFSNQSTSMLTAWTTPGQITSIPAVSFGGIRFQSGDRYLEDASFLRLRNVNLSYSLDSEVLAKTKFFTGARFYLQGTNLLTWTKWRGFDPESNRTTGNFFDFPVPRVVTFGVDLNF